MTRLRILPLPALLLAAAPAGASTLTVNSGWFRVVTDGFDVEVAGEAVSAAEVFSGLSEQSVLPETVEAPGGDQHVVQ